MRPQLTTAAALLAFAALATARAERAPRDPVEDQDDEGYSEDDVWDECADPDFRDDPDSGCPSPAARSPRARTGLELLVEPGGEAYRGREHRVRGIAFEVRGIATVRPLPGARVRARCDGPWVEAVAGPGGAFELAVAIPDSPDPTELEVEVRAGSHVRSVELPISVSSTIEMTARADRRLYQPGETARLWARVYDARTRRPLAGVSVRFQPDGRAVREQRVVTSAAGIAHVELPIEAEAEAGSRSVWVRVGQELGSVSSPVTFQVGRRPRTRIFAAVEISPRVASPGETVSARVEVRSVTGAPVVGAEVELEGRRLHTDPLGVATFELVAPELGGSVSLRGHVHHPGHGGADFVGSYGLRPPSALEVDILALRGGIVPEVRDRVVLAVFGGGGTVPAAGRRVEVRGPAVEGGRAVLTVDRHGFAALPVRAALGTFAEHVGSSDCSGGPATTLRITVLGDDPQRAERCVPVLERGLVAPSVGSPALGPGETVVVGLDRSPPVAGRPVLVELLALGGGRPELLAAVVAAPGTSSVRLRLPPDRLGLFAVRARPLLLADRAQGDALVDLLLVRPAVPSFPALALDRDVYDVRGRATLTVTTPAAAPPSHLALLVRDLAQHQGEAPFAERFLEGALSEAVLDPSTPEADLLVRTALAAHVGPEVRAGGVAPEDDPVVRARSLRAEAGSWMVGLERLLSEALGSEAVDEIATGVGPGRAFRDSALADAGDGEPPRTLGGDRATVAMLTDLDPSFTFDRVARRVARRRLVELLSVLAAHLDPEGNDTDRRASMARTPPDRWLSELVRRGALAPTDLHDPWGGTYVLRRTGRRAALVLAVEAEGYELASPGPDGRLGTADDVRDPFERVVPAGTLYARASGEDLLMAQLSALAPGAAALGAMLAAYDRLTDEALEELRGDALEGGGLYGSAGYAGGGSGYGIGVGRLGVTGRGQGGGGFVAGAAALAAIVREDFPATLLFVPELEVARNGSTPVAIPLAEAATTYVVETILWREDGWVWSAGTRLRVDQELVVDAPVPGAATVGDELVLPVRIVSRAAAARTLRVRVEGSATLGLEPIDAGPVTVPPHDAIDLPVRVRLGRVGRGTITVAVLSPSGEPLDAARRPIAVGESRRRARDEVETVLRGGGEVILTVPGGAEPDGTSRATVLVGPAIFRTGEHPSWERWVGALVGRGEPIVAELDRWERGQLVSGAAPLVLAHLLSAAWLVPSVGDATLSLAIEVLDDSVEGSRAEGAGDLRMLSRLLLLLAPAALHAGRRPALARPLRALVRALRVEVESAGALVADAPWLSARAAAALLWTARPGEAGARAEELLGRARAGLVSLGEDAWVEGGSSDSGDELFVASCLLALAEARAGRDEEAGRLVLSMVRLLRSGGGDLPEVASLSVEDRVLAGAAAAALEPGRPGAGLVLAVDGERRPVEVRGGVGLVAAPELVRGGRHRVEVTGAGRAVVLLRAETGYRVPWSEPPPLVGPFAVSIEGEPGEADGRSRLVLVVRNRVPRLVRQPFVELDLPAGAELDESARGRIASASGGSLDAAGERLTLRLRPLGPRGSVTVPLPWVWTVAGSLNGLGAAAWAADRPAAVSISRPRPVEIVRRGASGGTP